MEISEQEFQSAVRQGEELRRNGYAVSAEYDARQNRLVVGLSSGVTIMVPVHLVEDLAGADPVDLAEIEITGWPGWKIHESMIWRTGSPVAASMASHRSVVSVLAYEWTSR